MDYETGEYRYSLCEWVYDAVKAFPRNLWWRARAFWLYTILRRKRPTISELMAATLDKHLPALVSNVTTANALLKRLGEKPARRKAKGRKPNRRKAT